MTKCAKCNENPVTDRPGSKLCSKCFVDVMDEFLAEPTQDEMSVKAEQIVRVYAMQSGVLRDEHVQHLESMIRVALREVRDANRPRYTSPKRYG